MRGSARVGWGGEGGLARARVCGMRRRMRREDTRADVDTHTHAHAHTHTHTHTETHAYTYTRAYLALAELVGGLLAVAPRVRLGDAGGNGVAAEGGPVEALGQQRAVLVGGLHRVELDRMSAAKGRVLGLGVGLWAEAAAGSDGKDLASGPWVEMGGGLRSCLRALTGEDARRKAARPVMRTKRTIGACEGVQRQVVRQLR
jgi:hypothetical protein